jgi:5'-phosphate synthase pdxT subunit
MTRTIGILALQGDFAKHEVMFHSLGVVTYQIKKPEELWKCDGLVIPGGESTTLTKLMHRYGFYDPIRDFAHRYPIMGTCAGAILVATEVDDQRVRPLQLIDMAIKRNAYGRQIDSFITTVDAPCLGNCTPYRAIFIRAPQIARIGDKTKVLLELQGQPIMVQERNVLALTFHPELTNDARIHQYFLERS